LNPIFNKDAYDILTFNCNHCSDHVCMWLTGNHIPDEILNQAERVMDDNSIELLRPWVKKFSQ